MNKRLNKNQISKRNLSVLIKVTKTKDKDVIFKIVTSVFFLKLFIFLSFLYISKEQENNEIQDNYSYIELIVKGPGNTKIYYKNESNEFCRNIIPPDIIQINENQTIKNPDMEQYLNKEENNVKLIWINKKVNTLHCIFNRCNNITYADFSNFNSTFVESIGDLFNGCESLQFVNFNNFDSSNVKDMHYMFKNCKSLISIDLSNLDTSKVTVMNYMFFSCSSLEYVNLSKKFDTSSVTNMDRMFYGCSELIILNLSNFNTSNALNMNHMFSDCYKLESLDLSNFDTSKVNNMNSMFNKCWKLNNLDLSTFNTPNVLDIKYMFYECTLLESINLSIFDTKQIVDMSHVFENCKKLKTINLSNFNTSNAKSMSNMFSSCENLISIDLSNFITINVENMNNMFLNCKSLTSINLSNFDTSNLELIDNMFNGCLNLEYINLKNIVETYKLNVNNGIFVNTPENIVICLVQENTPLLTDLILKKNCSIIYCGDDWIQHQKKLIKGTDICLNNCSLDDQYKFEFRNKCYSKCPKESKEIRGNYCEALCDEEKPFVIVEIQECVDFCDLNLILSGQCVYKYVEIDESTEKSSEINKEENNAQEIKLQNKIIETIEKSFISYKYDFTNAQLKQDVVSFLSTNNYSDVNYVMTKTYNGDRENLLAIFNKNEYWTQIQQP